MREYVSDAVVLDVEPSGNLDTRITLFTRQFGKLVAKATSARKITSKLAGHLQPGHLVRARLVEKKGLRVADTLKHGSLRIRPADLYLLGRILPEGEPEQELWKMITNGVLEWGRTLALLGWDPAHAICASCSAKSPVAFHIQNQEFFCTGCVLNFRADELIYGGNAERV